MNRLPISSSNAVSLDYLRPSPVRGQLEALDPNSPEGWRYIQVTDTPAELKVLLPPATATMYEQLLKLENYELSKKTTVSWERILEIRHLKDRMIRKCQKLAKIAPGTTKKVSRSDAHRFQTLIAPSDFRLKEMEKWFREQQKRAIPPMNRSSPHRSLSSYCCSRCAAAGIMGPCHHSLQPQASSSKSPLLHRSITNPVQNGKGKEHLSLKPASNQSRLLKPDRTLSLPTPRGLILANAPPVASVLSPPPLPILLLAHREEYGLDSPDNPQSSSPQLPTTSQDQAVEGDDPSSGNSQENSTEDAVGDSQLRHRRSCIKRASIGDFAKTVSWADAQELDQQVSNYAAAAQQVQTSGKWEEVRVLYMEQIAGLENLHDQVRQGLEHLRSESEHLQRIDETIRHQREILDTTFQQFEQKHTRFQEKVQEALLEVTDALARNVKQDLPPINEH